jgi:hypothetical protein
MSLFEGHPPQLRESQAQKARSSGFQSGASGVSGQHQKLMAQAPILEEQISTGFENGCGPTQRES